MATKRVAIIRIERTATNEKEDVVLLWLFCVRSHVDSVVVPYLGGIHVIPVSNKQRDEKIISRT